jgi:hypothetical protein
MKTALLILCSALACATAGVPPDLIDARAAYRKAADGPAKELNTRDLFDARALLDQAEDAAKGFDREQAEQSAYLALRRAQLADAQGQISAAKLLEEQAQKH